MIDEINSFVDWLRQRNPQASTWRSYNGDLQRFLAVVGDKPPAEITALDVDAFVMTQAERGLQPATINRHISAVVSFYSYLSVAVPQIRCPVVPRRHLLQVQERLPRPVDQEDLRRFFAVIENTRDRAMFLLMLRCGLRIAEVTLLRLRDLRLGAHPPRIVVSGKNSRQRMAYLSSQANQAVLGYLSERPDTVNDALFLSYQLQALSTTAVHKRLMRYRKAADVYLTAHQLRHTFATQLVNSGCPITTIQVLMGHKNLNTTMRYTRVYDNTIADNYYSAMTDIEQQVQPNVGNGTASLLADTSKTDSSE